MGEDPSEENTMVRKTIVAVTAALVVATSFASVANAQRAPRQNQAVQSFTDVERNWFTIPEGRDDGMPRQ
jgi:hypothetical protein